MHVRGEWGWMEWEARMVMISRVLLLPVSLVAGGHWLVLGGYGASADRFSFCCCLF